MEVNAIVKEIYMNCYHKQNNIVVKSIDKNDP